MNDEYELTTFERGDTYMVSGDNRTWQVLKDGEDSVLGEWRGPGPDHWPGHPYAMRWHGKRQVRIDTDDSDDRRREDEIGYDVDLFGG